MEVTKVNMINCVIFVIVKLKKKYQMKVTGWQNIIYRSIAPKKLEMPLDLDLGLHVAQREEKFKVTPLALNETIVSQIAL